MTLCLIVLIALLIFTVFLFSKISISFVYHRKLRIYFRYACFKLMIYPRKKSTAKTYRASQTDTNEKHLFLNPRNICEETRKHFPTLLIFVKKLHISVGHEDPSRTVYLYLTITELFNVCLLSAKEFFPNIKILQTHIYPDFCANKIKFDANIVISLSFYQFMRFFLYLLHNHTSINDEKQTA